VYQPQPLKKVVPRLDLAGIDLLTVCLAASVYRLRVLMVAGSLQRMLQYEPNKRISAEQAMQHQYFKDLKLQKKPT